MHSKIQPKLNFMATLACLTYAALFIVGTFFAGDLYDPNNKMAIFATLQQSILTYYPVVIVFIVILLWRVSQNFAFSYKRKIQLPVTISFTIFLALVTFVLLFSVIDLVMVRFDPIQWETFSTVLEFMPGGFNSLPTIVLFSVVAVCTHFLIFTGFAVKNCVLCIKGNKEKLDRINWKQRK